MTPNPPRQPEQPSQPAPTSAIATILNIIIGLVLIAFGGGFLWLEMHSPPTHTIHVIVFSVIALLGALLIRPDPLLVVIKQLFVVAGPYIPVVGGRRRDDPPGPGAPGPES